GGRLRPVPTGDLEEQGAAVGEGRAPIRGPLEDPMGREAPGLEPGSRQGAPRAARSTPGEATPGGWLEHARRDARAQGLLREVELAAVPEVVQAHEALRGGAAPDRQGLPQVGDGAVHELRQDPLYGDPIREPLEVLLSVQLTEEGGQGALLRAGVCGPVRVRERGSGQSAEARDRRIRRAHEVAKPAHAAGLMHPACRMQKPARGAPGSRLFPEEEDLDEGSSGARAKPREPSGPFFADGRRDSGAPWRRLLRRGRLVSRAFPRRPCSLGLPEAGAGDPRRAGGRVHRAGLPARRSCTERARRDRWFLERRRGPRLLVVDRAEDAGPPTFPVLLATPGSSMNSNFSLASLVVWYVVFLFSTTFHEFSHAIVAYWGGDKTAHDGGQVSLDPMPHIRRSPFGLVLAPLVTFPLFGWMIGWASAPYDPRWAAAHPKRYAL